MTLKRFPRLRRIYLVTILLAVMPALYLLFYVHQGRTTHLRNPLNGNLFLGTNEKHPARLVSVNQQTLPVGHDRTKFVWSTDIPKESKESGKWPKTKNIGEQKKGYVKNVKSGFMLSVKQWWRGEPRRKSLQEFPLHNPNQYTIDKKDFARRRTDGKMTRMKLPPEMLQAKVKVKEREHFTTSTATKVPTRDVENRVSSTGDMLKLDVVLEDTKKVHVKPEKLKPEAEETRLIVPNVGGDRRVINPTQNRPLRNQAETKVLANFDHSTPKVRVKESEIVSTPGSFLIQDHNRLRNVASDMMKPRPNDPTRSRPWRNRGKAQMMKQKQKQNVQVASQMKLSQPRIKSIGVGPTRAKQGSNSEVGLLFHSDSRKNAAALDNMHVQSQGKVGNASPSHGNVVSDTDADFAKKKIPVGTIMRQTQHNGDPRVGQSPTTHGGTGRPKVCDGCFKPNISYLINPKFACKQGDKSIEVIVMVFSEHGNKDKRTAIRETWGSITYNNVGVVRLVFALALIDDKAKMAATTREAVIHEDILMGNFQDSYRNLTLKTVMLLGWVTEYCSSAKYFFKTDDDMWVNIPMFLTLAQQYPIERSLSGTCFTEQWRAVRDRTNKYFVTDLEYSDEYYPSLCVGTAYVMTLNTARDINQIHPNIPFFHLEDVYLALCREYLGYPVVPLPGFYNVKEPFSVCYYRTKIVTSHWVSEDEVRAAWTRDCFSEPNDPISDFLARHPRVKNENQRDETPWNNS